MNYEIATVICGGPGLKVPKPKQTTVFRYDNRKNTFSPRQAYQKILDVAQSDVLMYAHDDLEITDPAWCPMVMFAMAKPNVVAVGFGGAPGLGNRNLYRKPYDIWSLARIGYGDNQRDAEIHGDRITYTRRVAVIEQYFMAVNVTWLRSRGGWPSELSHHGLDMWLACEAARDRKEIWTVPVTCIHHGGASSTKGAYAKAKWLQGGTLETDHALPHAWIFDKYRDVLPIEVS